ncbi:MAG: hypothetical protein EOO93_02670 [Pedobacter sp.]|nr:MAG: hypothetical protein EOO93_02670 [Pedobacter sp.]
MDNYSSNNVQSYIGCIKKVSLFQQIINPNNEFYYRPYLLQWENERNQSLLANKVLSQKQGWLKPFNRELRLLIEKVIIAFKNMLSYYQEGKPYDVNTLSFLISSRLEFLSQMPHCIRLNLDVDKIIANEIRDYCLNGFKLMTDYLENELLINLTASPAYEPIAEVIYNIQQSINSDFTISKPKEEENLYPKVFADTKAFKVFRQFSEKYITDYYIDYSFIFQQMKSKGLILDIKHKTFYDWLFHNKYITEKQHFKFEEERGFRSLKKCNNAKRLNNYFLIKDNVFADLD